MIKVKQIWLAIEPMDMRCGVDTALARVIRDFGSARPHHAYVFANKRHNRIKAFVHDGIGVWLAARRLNKGKFIWPRPDINDLNITQEQLDALVLGLPWQMVGEAGILEVY